MEQNPANVVALSDKFVTTYPMSQLMGYVQRFRMMSLMRTGKCQDSINAGETCEASCKTPLNRFLKYFPD